MCLIYSLQFSNGKKYIGMTAQSFPDRMATHRMGAKRSEAAVYRAWRKYGEPKATILALVEKHMLRDAERKAIAVFKTMVPNGYNLVSGGGGGAISAESRRKMSLSRKGKPKSAEHRKNISLGQLGRPGTWLGKKHSPEHIARRVASYKITCAARRKLRKQEIRQCQ